MAKKQCAKEAKLMRKVIPIQYLKLNRDLKFNDLCFGRYTTLEKGACGFVLNEYEIVHLHGASSKKKKIMFEEMLKARDLQRTYALVGGYPCSLRKEEFELLDKTPTFCIGELI